MAYEGPGGTAPLHGSFEDRPDAPDRVFAALSDADYERQVARVVARAERRRGAEQADVLHLHHLTPLHAAAARVAPDVPIVTHLHGTELLMLEAIAQRGPRPGRTRRVAGAPAGWAAGSERSSSRRQPGAGVALLGGDARPLSTLANGRPAAFRPLNVDREAVWRRRLVDEPRGWRPGGAPGDVRYTAPELEPLARGTVLVYSGASPRSSA